MHEQVKKESPKLQPGRLELAVDARNHWVATVEAGTTKEQMRDPAFWSNFSAQFRPYDHIEVRTDDGSYWAEYLVLSCDRTWARVHLIIEQQLSTEDVSLTQAVTHEIKYRGPHCKFSVIRLADAAIVKEGCQTKDEAAGWLKDHLKVVA